MGEAVRLRKGLYHRAPMVRSGAVGGVVSERNGGSDGRGPGRWGTRSRKPLAMKPVLSPRDRSQTRGRDAVEAMRGGRTASSFGP